MKRNLLIIVVVLVALLVAAVVVVGLSLDKIVKKAVETAGPAVTHVDVRLDDVNLSLMNGEGALHGFALGNPKGYTSPSCIEFNLASLAIKPSSVLSDKVVIRHVRLDAPVITLEGGLDGINLIDLVKGMQSEAEDSDEEAPPAEEETEAAGSRKLQVDEFSLTGATLHAIIDMDSGRQTNTLKLPDIVITNLGTGPEGVTAKELCMRVLQPVAVQSLDAVRNDPAWRDLAEGVLKDWLGKSLTDWLGLDEDSEVPAKTIQGVMDMFNKKTDK